MNKPLTIEDLAMLCKEEIKKGNGDKVIMISSDDEGNGYHYLWYSFCSPDEAYIDEYMIDERIATKDDTIILG